MIFPRGRKICFRFGSCVLVGVCYTVQLYGITSFRRDNIIIYRYPPKSKRRDSRCTRVRTAVRDTYRTTGTRPPGTESTAAHGLVFVDVPRRAPARCDRGIRRINPGARRLCQTWRLCPFVGRCVSSATDPLPCSVSVSGMLFASWKSVRMHRDGHDLLGRVDDDNGSSATKVNVITARCKKLLWQVYANKLDLFTIIICYILFIFFI